MQEGFLVDDPRSEKARENMSGALEIGGRPGETSVCPSDFQYRMERARGAYALPRLIQDCMADSVAANLPRLSPTRRFHSFILGRGTLTF